MIKFQKDQVKKLDNYINIIQRSNISKYFFLFFIEDVEYFNENEIIKINYKFQTFY